MRHLKTQKRHRGFIIFFGWRSVVGSDGAAPLQIECPSCHRQVMLLGKQHRKWFTLFFIPVIPLSSPTRFSECNTCHAQFRMNVDEMRQRIAAEGDRMRQTAITLHNSLVAAPKNSVALQQLMLTYASLKEYDQAVAAARQFEQALNESEQCMTTLGRICLARGEHAIAIQWFDAAINRNSDLAEPHYYKAVALLNEAAPNVEGALAEARQARRLGHPDADNLMRHVETRAQKSPPPLPVATALPQQPAA